MRRWLAAFETLLRGAVADPDQPLGKLPILLATTTAARSRAWNRTEADYPRDDARRGADRRDRAPRARSHRRAQPRHGALTYGELAQRARRDRRGAARARRAARRSRRPAASSAISTCSPAILGTLAAGAAYVPLDPAFPADRLRFMVEDAARRRDRHDQRDRRRASRVDRRRARRRASTTSLRRPSRRPRRRSALARHAPRTPPTSSTPRARPASRRACASRTARSSTSCASVAREPGMTRARRRARGDHAVVRHRGARS